MDLAPDFDEFCGLLLAHHVEFAVVGAYALAFHGPLGAHQVPFIGRETFLRNKRAAGRAKDLADIDALREPNA